MELTESMIKNNPIAYSSTKQKLLDAAKQILLDTLEEYIKENNLSPDEIAEVKNYIEEAYSEKKAAYFLEDKLIDLSTYLNYSLNFALNNKTEKKPNKDILKTFSRIFYYRNKKHVLTHERY